MGEYGVYVSNSGEAVRHRKALGMEHLKLLFKVNPEADAYLVQRDIQVVARSIMFGDFADGLCVSGQQREQSLTMWFCPGSMRQRSRRMFRCSATPGAITRM